eukprot:551491_1
MSTKVNKKKSKRPSGRLSISLKSPYEWTTHEVSEWLKSIDYTAQSQKFKTASIDGSKLFTLDRTTLQNDIKIFDATARNGILKEISKLKTQIKEMQKLRVEKFASTHTRKVKKSETEEEKNEASTDLPDTMKLRTYAYIKIKPNGQDTYDIQSVLNLCEFKTAQHREWIEEHQEDCALQYCALNGKKKTVFMFVITNSKSKSKPYHYLFTKPVKEWNIQNVFEYTRHVHNHEFILFADELKRKKIDGAKLLKYTRQKLQTDYGNFFDSTLRKKILDEIKLLKNENKTNNDKKPKRYHSAHQRTKSEMERDRIERQKMRKAGPRDVGKIKYKGTKYDDSKDKAFLEDTIHPLSKDEKFQKRKKANPVSKKETVKEIGKVKYDGAKYDDSGDAGFLDDRMNPLSKDERFQKRKELNPVSKKKTVKEIGKVKYDGAKYDDSGDAGFLDDRMNPLSKDERFQKRKELNPVSKKKTVKEIGKVKYDGAKYDDSGDAGFLDDRMNPLSKDERFQKRKQANPVSKKETVEEIGKVKYDGAKYDDSNDSGFLADRMNPLSKDERFQKRKQANPVSKRETVEEIGKADDFKGPNWKLEDVVDHDAFLSDNAYYRSRTALITNPDGTVEHKPGAVDTGTVHGFKKPEWSDKVEQDVATSDGWMSEKIKKEDKDYSELATHMHKQGAVEVGKIHGFDAIDYELKPEDLIGGFLDEKLWHESSKVNQDFDAISRLLRTLPASKLHVMYSVPLPTGFNTKVMWLKKLREIVEHEFKNEKDQKDNELRKKQLDELDAMLQHLHVEIPKEK